MADERVDINQIWANSQATNQAAGVPSLEELFQYTPPGIGDSEEEETALETMFRGAVAKASEKIEPNQESFSQFFNRTTSAGDLLGNFFSGLGAGIAGRKFTEIRDRRFEEFKQVKQQQFQAQIESRRQASRLVRDTLARQQQLQIKNLTAAIALDKSKTAQQLTAEKIKQADEHFVVIMDFKEDQLTERRRAIDIQESAEKHIRNKFTGNTYQDARILLNMNLGEVDENDPEASAERAKLLEKKANELYAIKLRTKQRFTQNTFSFKMMENGFNQQLPVAFDTKNPGFGVHALSGRPAFPWEFIKLGDATKQRLSKQDTMASRLAELASYVERNKDVPGLALIVKGIPPAELVELLGEELGGTTAPEKMVQTLLGKIQQETRIIATGAAASAKEDVAIKRTLPTAANANLLIATAKFQSASIAALSLREKMGLDFSRLELGNVMIEFHEMAVESTKAGIPITVPKASQILEMAARRAKDSLILMQLEFYREKGTIQ